MKLDRGAGGGSHVKLLQTWQPFHLNDAIDAALRYGCSGLLVKALDGADWMSTFDKRPDAISSIEHAAATWRACADRGLTCHVWTVPKPADWETQADLTAALANATHGVFLDVEPYEHFWGAWQPVGLATAFMARVRSGTGTFIALQPDPRQGRFAEIRPGEWLPYCDALAGQHYWHDFGTSPSDEIEQALAIAAAWGKLCIPTLQVNVPPSSLPHAQIERCAGVILWRLGIENPETALAIQNPHPTVEAPSAPSAPAPALALADICDRVGDLIEQEANRTPGPRRTQLRAIVSHMRTTREEFLGPRTT